MATAIQGWVPDKPLKVFVDLSRSDIFGYNTHNILEQCKESTFNSETSKVFIDSVNKLFVKGDFSPQKIQKRMTKNVIDKKLTIVIDENLKNIFDILNDTNKKENQHIIRLVIEQNELLQGNWNRDPYLLKHSPGRTRPDPEYIAFAILKNVQSTLTTQQAEYVNRNTNKSFQRLLSEVPTVAFTPMEVKSFIDNDPTVEELTLFRMVIGMGQRTDDAIKASIGMNSTGRMINRAIAGVPLVGSVASYFNPVKSKQAFDASKQGTLFEGTEGTYVSRKGLSETKSKLAEPRRKQESVVQSKKMDRQESILKGKLTNLLVPTINKGMDKAGVQHLLDNIYASYPGLIRQYKSAMTASNTDTAFIEREISHLKGERESAIKALHNLLGQSKWRSTRKAFNDFVYTGGKKQQSRKQRVRKTRKHK